MVDDGLLDSMRQMGDPLADAAVTEAFATGNVHWVNDLLVTLHRNDDPLPNDLPPALRRYFLESATLPSWADRATLDRGRELWTSYGSHLATILHAYSMPVSFGWAKAAQVLYRTFSIQRVLENGQFLQDVHGGLLAPDEYGLRSAQKIRLTHATIRHYLRNAPDWHLGVALNQEDLAATMGTFSVCLPKGLLMLGVDLSEADRDDFFHIWSVVGHVLGVNTRLMPSSYEQGLALMDRIWRRQWAQSEAGAALTGVLVDAMGRILGPGLRGAPSTLIRHFCGDSLADMLGVPSAEWTALALDASIGLSAAFGQTGDRAALLSRVSSRAGEVLLAASSRGRSLDQMVD